MGKCIFVLFRDFFPFNWKAKLMIYAKLIKLRYTTYGLETCHSNLGSIKHACISMISHREKGQSNETPPLAKSTNLGIWVVGTTNQLFIKGS